MPSKRKFRSDVIRLIVTTRERFPHTPGLTIAMRRLIWRYAAEAEAATRKRRKRRAKKSARGQ
ncbi:MAG TPA: hypothetical protein VII92_10570 [Anaerolineae bacterium]